MLGGNGYVEESLMPRLYREAPVNSIWEGSGNVNALDLLRVAAKEPGALDVLFDEASEARGADARFDAALASLRADLEGATDPEVRARSLVERMALVLQASLLRPARARRGRRRVLRVAARGRLGRDVRHAAGGNGLRRDRATRAAGGLAADRPEARCRRSSGDPRRAPRQRAARRT